MKLIPEMTYPVPRGLERYEQAVKVADVAARMGEYGVRVDIGQARWHRKDALRRADFFLNKFLQLTGLEMSSLGASLSGQTNAVRDWFWKKNEAPVLSRHKRTKKPQFNTATLIGYATDFKGYPFAPAAAALYGLRAARTAYRFADAYAQVAGHYDGRIRFGFNTLGTKGERWSASAKFAWWDKEKEAWAQFSLNAQNVPSKRPFFEFDGEPVAMALPMRDIFIPDPGCVFWKSDYQALEGELIACNSGAKNLLAWLADGIDMHIEHARLFFGDKRVPLGAKKGDSDLIDLYRDCAKPLMYGFTYQVRNGRGDDEYPEAYKTLKKSLPWIAPQIVQMFARAFFAKHPEIDQLQADVREAIRRHNRIELPLNGAFLILPDTPRGRNQGINFLHQSVGGYLINRALVEIAKQTKWDQPYTTAPLLQVHDELAGQCRVQDIEATKQLVQSEMSRPAEFKHITKGVPCKVLTGENWMSCG